jgi:hypothetical protein
MAIEVFQGGSIPRELSSGAMEFLWAKWKTLNATNSLSFQRLLEESHLPVRANLICMLQTGDDFIYMYVGKALQGWMGVNPTGWSLSASGNPVSRDLLEVYRQSAKTGTPSFVRFATSRGSGNLLQGLVLPIRLTAETALVIGYAEESNLQSDVCEFLFQTSTEAMMIASPIANDVGDVLDGWVVMMNDAARELLDFRDGIGNLRLKHLPQLQKFNFGFKLHPPVPAGTRSRLAPAHGLNAEVIRFAHTFALRLSRVTVALPTSNEAPTLAPA